MPTSALLKECVRHTAGNDDVGPKFQCLHEPCRADVGVHRQNPRTDIGERLACVHVDQRLSRLQQFIEAWVEIIAEHHRHSHAIGETQFFRQRLNGGAAGSNAGLQGSVYRAVGSSPFWFGGSGGGASNAGVGGAGGNASGGGAGGGGGGGSRRQPATAPIPRATATATARMRST